MYVEIALKGDNKGGVGKFVEYLDKDQKTDFFDANDNVVFYQDIVDSIDGNVKGLGRDESKFYGLSINPSSDELNFIANKNNIKIDSFDKLTDEEKDIIFSELQKYTHKVMNNYAVGFNRDKVKSADDLIYFSRIETERHYKHYDKAVVEGRKKAGDKKEGLNIHVHIIVSRKSKAGVKLSPNKNKSNKVFEQGGKTISRGFNYTEFINDNLNDFKEQTGYIYKGNRSTYDNSLLGKAKTIAKGQVKARAVSQVRSASTNALTQGMLRDELKGIGKSMQVVKALKVVSKANPQMIAKEVLVKSIKFIIGESIKVK